MNSNCTQIQENMAGSGSGSSNFLSSLCRDLANLLCIVPVLVYVLLERVWESLLYSKLSPTLCLRDGIWIDEVSKGSSEGKDEVSFRIYNYLESISSSTQCR